MAGVRAPVTVPARAGRLAAALARRPARAALGLGVLAALTLPPVYALPGLLAFAGLLWLILHAPSVKAAFLFGWCFGFGYFLAGLYWVAIAFFVEADRFGPLALPAVLLLAGGLALFPATAAALVRLRSWRSPVAAALALALAWSAGELLRGEIGGFPWNLAGYAFTVSDALLQPAALVGVYGLSLLAVAIGALPAALLEDHGRRHRLAVLAALALLPAMFLGGALRLASAPDGEVPDVRLRLVQANVDQAEKWDPELVDRWFERHRRLSAEGAGSVTHVIWPESATPYQLERDELARLLIAQVTPPGGLLLTGAERFDFTGPEPIATNSLYALDERGAIRARYDKVDLVPFGEFLPLRALLGRIGLEALTRGTIDFQPGPGRRTLALDGLPPFSPLICYEAIFPGHAIDRDQRPAWLLNVTNDAWFGRSSGPYQHFAMARVRAVEEGLPLVRAANSGISAVVDAHGRVRARLGLGAMGVLDSPLPEALSTPPPYARIGPLLVAAIALLLAIALVLAERLDKTGART